MDTIGIVNETPEGLITYAEQGFVDRNEYNALIAERAQVAEYIENGTARINDLDSKIAKLKYIIDLADAKKAQEVIPTTGE